MIINRIGIRQLGPIESADITLGNGADPSLADVHMFVGQNGTGKTTVLEAIAACLSDEASHATVSRVRRQRSLCVIQGDLGTVVWSAQVGQLTAFEQRPLQLISMHAIGALRYGRSAPVDDYDRALARYDENAANAVVGAQAPIRFPFAAFAYSAYRRVGAVSLQGLEAPNERPLSNALTATLSQDHDRLVRWIALAKTQAALVKEKGDAQRAERFSAPLLAVERVISEITERRFAFDLEAQPFAVKASIDGVSVSLDVLPDGLKSILSWICDLLLRLSRLDWETERPVNEQPFLLLLDEVEVHLHPRWQRRLLPTVQTLFPNAQIMISTHSPFVVGSVSDAWIYPFLLKDGAATVAQPLPAQVGHSYSAVLQEVFGVSEEFDVESERRLDHLYDLRQRALRGDQAAYDDFLQKAAELGERSPELYAIASREVAQLRSRWHKQ